MPLILFTLVPLRIIDELNSVHFVCMILGCSSRLDNESYNLLKFVTSIHDNEPCNMQPSASNGRKTARRQGRTTSEKYGMTVPKDPPDDGKSSKKTTETTPSSTARGSQ